MPENTPAPIEPEALAAAREQAEDMEGFLRPFEIPTKDGSVYKVIHPQMLDDDGVEAYELMLWEFNQCDKLEVDIPAVTYSLPDGTSTTIPAHTEVRGFIEPRQKDGKKISPNQQVRTLKILCGSDEEYERAKALGVTGNALGRAMNARVEEERKRRTDDSKSVDSPVVSEEVAEAD